MSLKLTLTSLPILLSGGLLFWLYEFATEPWHIKAAKEIVAWGERHISHGGGGRNCSLTTDAELRRAARKPDGVQEVGNLISFEGKRADACFRKASLRQLKYNSRDGVLAGVWRCEEGDIVGEFRLSYVEPPRKIGGADWFCDFAVFKPEWNIPVGEATYYPTP